jgi:MFS family permease
MSPNILRTMRLSIFEGSFSQIFILLSTGSVLTGYMLHYGASPSQIALVSSVPLLSQLLSPFAAWWASRLTQRRFICVVLVLIGRLLWLLAALAPQLGIAANAIPIFLLVLVGVSSFFQASVMTIWTAWMGDVIPEDTRGRFFGRRSGVVGVVGMVANLAAGWFLDAVAAPINFQVVLGLSVVFAILAAVLLFWHYDPVIPKEGIDGWQVISLPWREANFRTFMAFSGLLYFGIFLSAAIITVYFLEDLGLNFSQLALWSAIAAIVNLVTAEVWGRLADRIGNKTVTLCGLLVMGIGFPLTWILADLIHIGFFWLSAVIDSLAWGAAGPAIFNLSLASAPKGNRASYIAMYSLVTGLAGFISGSLSGPLYEFLNQLELGSWKGYYSLFILSGLCRLASIVPLMKLQEVRK